MDHQLLNELGTGQHGIVTRTQLLHRGCSPSEVDRAVHRSILAPVHAGVYRLAGSPDTPRQRLEAAVRAAGPDAGVSHRAAAALLGAAVDRHDELVEISVARARAPRLSQVIVHRSRDLTQSQLTKVDGLPVTTPTRLLVDLGAVVPWWQVSRTLERLLASRAVTMPEVRAALDWHSKRGRTGCGVLRQVLDRRALGEQNSESVLESLFAELCRTAELPLPIYQHELRVDGRTRRLDFAYPNLMIAIEVDGYEFHSGRAQFDDDRRRDNALQLLGWKVLRFTWEQVIYRPQEVVRALRAALATPQPPELGKFSVAG